MTYIQNIIKNILILSILVFILGCNNSKENNISTNEEIVNTDSKITSKDIAKLKYTDYALSRLTQNKTSNWQKFNELTNIIEILKSGDLSFFKDDKAILTSFLNDLKNEVPEYLNTPSVLVRLSVIETAFLKLEGLAILSSAKKEDLLKTIKDVLVSYTNLVFQMNKKFEKESQNIVKPN